MQKFCKNTSQITRRNFLGALPALAAGQALTQKPKSSNEPESRPNIVLIVADDLGYGDLKCYGGKVETPNLEKLANEGMRFTQSICGNAVCSPSRATLLTGLYSERFGVSNVIRPQSTTGIPQGIFTLAAKLGYPSKDQEKGYKTAMAGKWHAGHQIGQRPPDHGFQDSFWIPYSHDMFPLPLLSGTKPVEMLWDPAMGIDKRSGLDERFTDFAVNFLRQQKKEDPFFLYLAYTRPHLPLDPLSSDNPEKLYASTVEGLDNEVGKVLSAVRLIPNTLVVFTSDNGANLGKFEKIPPGSMGNNGPLDGGKYELKEGGVRVPLCCWMPEKIVAGVTNEPVFFHDFSPTFCHLAGFDPNDDHVGFSDGQNIWDLITGADKRVKRSHSIIEFEYGNPRTARGRFQTSSGECNVKLWFDCFKDGRMFPLAMFDMDTDIAEQHSILSENEELAKQMLKDVACQLSFGFIPQTDLARQNSAVKGNFFKSA